MLLDSTLRKLQVVLSEAHTTNALAVVASYFDSGTPNGGGPALSVTNGTTPVDIVGAPSASYKRQVNELTVFNADTVSHGVTVRYNDNAALYTIIKVTLLTGETLTYSKSLGWHTLDASGNLKSTFNGMASTNLSDFKIRTSFTPILAFGGASVGITYSTQAGYYTVHGDKVFIEIQLDLSNKGSSTGAATISGLPFPSTASGSVTRWVLQGFSTATPTAGIAGFFQITGQGVSQLDVIDSSGNPITNTGFANGTVCRFVGWYTK